MGGHTNFIVNHTRIAKTIIWTNRVALMLTATPFLWTLRDYFKTKGFANANIMAIPTPIKKAASIKPANKNILVCSSFINSG